MRTDSAFTWVIHKYWSGDSSARVIFFTKEYGLVNCFYKGGRSPKKQALLQAFLPLWLAIDVKKDAHFVRHLEIANAPLTLPARNLFAGLYLNELLYLALKPQDPHPKLYATYQTALTLLSRAIEKLEIESILRRFEWQLLSSCGYQLSFTVEARTFRAIEPHLNYHLMATEGFIEASEGICGAHILAMAQDDLSDPRVLKALKHIMRQAIAHAIDGKEIRARRLYATSNIHPR